MDHEADWEIPRKGYIFIQSTEPSIAMVKSFGWGLHRSEIYRWSFANWW